CVRTSAILLLLALRRESESAEHHDALTFLHAAGDFGIIEVASAELHDARLEARLATVRHDDETLTCTLRPAPHLRRRRELPTATTTLISLPVGAARRTATVLRVLLPAA